MTFVTLGWQYISGSKEKRNGGTVVYGGNITSNDPTTNAPGLGMVGYRSGVCGAVVPPPTATSATYKPYSGANFAHNMVAGQYIGLIIGKYIAGVANNLLVSGAADFGRKSIAYVNSLRTSFLQGYAFSSSGHDYAMFTETYSNHNLSFGTDNAAQTTLAIPGDLVYLQGGLIPLQKHYQAKSG